MACYRFLLFVILNFVFLLACLLIFAEALPAGHSRWQQDSSFEMRRQNSRRLRLRQNRMHGHSNYQQSRTFQRSPSLMKAPKSSFVGMPAKLFTYAQPDAAEKLSQKAEYKKSDNFIAGTKEVLAQERLKHSEVSATDRYNNKSSAGSVQTQKGLEIFSEDQQRNDSGPSKDVGLELSLLTDLDMEQSDQGSNADEIHGKDTGMKQNEGESLPKGQGKDSIILLTANPQTIVLGETEHVMVTCSINMAQMAGESSAHFRPMSVEIDKHDGQSRKRLAVLSAIHGAIPIRDELTENARISGNVPINSEDPWTISITWSTPSPALAGTYICKLTALGSNMAHVDYAYSKTDVLIKESPRLQLEERIDNIDIRLKEMMKDKERKDALILKLRSLLFNVTTVLVDTSSNTLDIKKKINLQAKAYINLRSDVLTALDSDQKVEEKLNATEDKVASILGIITNGMSLLHKQNRIFASGLQALKLQVNGVQEEISNARDRLKEKLDSQRLEMANIRKAMDGAAEERASADERMADIGRQVAQLSHALNKTADKLHNLQAVLGLTDGSIRLINNGVTGREGRLEVFHNGQWGSVCDDHFDVKAAQVVCKQLGFESATAAFFGNAHYGQGVGIPIHLDDVVCYGEETMLVKCSHNAWGFHGCTHAEDVGVKC